MLQIREGRNNHVNHDISLVLYYWIDLNSIFFIIYNIFATWNTCIRFWPDWWEGSLFWQIWVSKRSLFWILLGLYWVSIFFKRVSYNYWAPCKHNLKEDRYFGNGVCIYLLIHENGINNYGIILHFPVAIFSKKNTI